MKGKMTTPFIVIRTYIVNIPEEGEPERKALDAWMREQMQDMDDPNPVTPEGIAEMLTYASDVGDWTEIAQEVNSNVIKVG
jgi:hypothetical protein